MREPARRGGHGDGRRPRRGDASAGSRTPGRSAATRRRSTGHWPKRTRAAGSTCAPRHAEVERSLREGWRRWRQLGVVRTLFRSVLDGTHDHADAAYAEQVRLAAAALLSEMAAVVRTFGGLIRDRSRSRARRQGPAQRRPRRAAPPPGAGRGAAAGRPPQPRGAVGLQLGAAHGDRPHAGRARRRGARSGARGARRRRAGPAARGRRAGTAAGRGVGRIGPHEHDDPD